MIRTATIAKLMIPVVLAAALIAVFAAHSGTAGSMSKQQVVTTANNPTLHQKVLVNRKGLTLYSLSVEQRGRFICTDNLGVDSAHSPEGHDPDRSTPPGHREAS
jgi:predicted lipoprotein with Yx(FWY)xxD motif